MRGAAFTSAIYRQWYSWPSWRMAHRVRRNEVLEYTAAQWLTVLRSEPAVAAVTPVSTYAPKVVVTKKVR